MKLFSWNVNGIRAVINKGEFAKFIEQYDPDVICLQETKAKQNQAEIDLAAYQEFWNSADKAGYSGTAIFSKVKPLSVIYGFSDDIAQKYNLADDSYGDPAKEGRVISAEFDKFWVVTVYTPNSKGDLSRLKLRHLQWDPAFLEHVTALEKTKPVLFSGDLNVAHQEIDIKNPASNKNNAGFTPQERGKMTELLRSGLTDSFRHLYPDRRDAYSWWSYMAKARERNIGWRIDYFLVSNLFEPQIREAAILPEVMGSDHCPVVLEIF